MGSSRLARVRERAGNSARIDSKNELIELFVVLDVNRSGCQNPFTTFPRCPRRNAHVTLYAHRIRPPDRHRPAVFPGHAFQVRPVVRRGGVSRQPELAVQPRSRRPVRRGWHRRVLLAHPGRDRPRGPRRRGRDRRPPAGDRPGRLRHRHGQGILPSRRGRRRRRHPAAAAVPDRSLRRRRGRARRAGLQVDPLGRDRLQPRQPGARREPPGAPGRALPEPGRLQGWRGRPRA